MFENIFFNELNKKTPHTPMAMLSSKRINYMYLTTDNVMKLSHASYLQYFYWQFAIKRFLKYTFFKKKGGGRQTTLMDKSKIV